MEIGSVYLKIIRSRFSNVKELGDRTLSQLSETEMHWRPNESSNSAAIIVQHMSGNMVSRWTDFLTTDGEKTTRNRDREFEEHINSKQQLQDVWEKGWEVLFHAVDGLQSQDLLATITIRGESHYVLEAIERQLAHYAYHVGQIVYIGKQLKSVDWETLSIPKGKSTEYLREQLKKHRT
ncbi:DUF1572 domain-containing protein [Ornithinibacillus gellani]|uniref:DUF1572 family protein n=1 Tax=Ornithinibacillus gellani TaxID=2293253 RepID=UPI000F462E84|nr:DUF1572 family protein [Ornithinibacillus gellani]TQS75196.1 DUF1572 domain-containing protein [Ornithinibacillus gellani]